jgi:hypothetical protein
MTKPETDRSRRYLTTEYLAVCRQRNEWKARALRAERKMKKVEARS